MNNNDSLRFASDEISSAAMRGGMTTLRCALSLAFGVLLAIDTVAPSMKSTIILEFARLPQMDDRALETLAGAIMNEIARAGQ